MVEYRWALRGLLGTLVFVASSSVGATDVNVVGISQGRAIVVIGQGAPRVIREGSEVEGVKLLSTSGESADFVIDGKRQTLHLGQFYGGSAQNGRSSTTLTPDGRGHYVTQGSINGGSIIFLVDTGATFVVLSGADAHRLGIAYNDAPQYAASTANGYVTYHKVTLNTVKVGDIVLNNVDAAVQDTGLATGALLGMSFLSRTEISHEGSNMVLTKRF
ncbi:MAG: TIGR02281 family clan AA aspartic protease [Burkholderiaceae bacterium]